MPGMKRVYRDTSASVHWSAARNKERFLFPDMPCRVHRDRKATVHWSAARNEERFSSR